MQPFDRRLLDRASAVRVALVVDVAAGVLGTLLLLAQVTIVATIVASVVDRSVDTIGVAPVVWLAAIVAVRAALAQVVERMGRSAATRVMSSLRLELVARRLRHGGAELDDVAEGDAAALASAAVTGVDGLETYFARYLPQVVLAVTVPAAVLIWSAIVDLQSALIMLVTIPLIPLFLWLIGRATASRAAANVTAMVTLAAHFLDVLRGLPTLRAFNRGRAQLPALRDTAERYRRTTMATLRLSFLSGFVMDLATTLSIAMVAVTLGVRLVGGSLDLRPALIVLLLVPELYAPIRAVGTLYHASADGLAGAERMLTVLEHTAHSVSEDVSLVGASALSSADDTITLRDVTVRYPGRAVPALDGIDLEIGAREFVVVRGPSGAGKSTLGRVLVGLTRPDAGAVLVGDRQLGPEDLDGWRHLVALSSQRPALLHATVAENIALGLPDAQVETVALAARSAGAEEFVAALPEGFDTRIGSGGRGLSAGQRQRLGLARALVRNAELLVLDEPTAHLDDDAARRVSNTITGLRGSCTIVLFTHDPAFEATADRVLHLAAGRVVQP